MPGDAPQRAFKRSDVLRRQFPGVRLAHRDDQEGGIRVLTSHSLHCGDAVREDGTRVRAEFDDDGTTAEVAQPNGLAVNVRQVEVRGRLARPRASLQPAPYS